MSTTAQITGGGFQDVAGNVLSEGYILLTLSQDAQVNATTQIAAGTEIKITLNSSGSVDTTVAQSVWPNDVLSPANTFYNVSAYAADGQLVWGPNAQQVLSSPSPFDIGAWVPGAVNVLNPGGNITGLIEEGTNVTITGSGTSTDPYNIASTGGGGGGVTSFNTRTGAVTLDSSDVTTALAYTPVNKAGDTMTGLLLLSANPTANLGAATKQYVDASGGSAITALTGDVTASGPGSAAATVVKVNGASVPASHAYVGTNSSSQIIAATTPLLPSNNLSDVSSESTARTNLGLGTMATQNASAVAVTGGTAELTSLQIGAGSPGTLNATATQIYGTDGSSTQWQINNANGEAIVKSLVLNSSQQVSGVQGTTGTEVVAATGSFTSGNLTATDANGNLVDSGVAKPTSAFGTMATQNASSVAVTGGTVDGTTVGATTPAVGTFTTLKSTVVETGASNNLQLLADGGGGNIITFNGVISGSRIAIDGSSTGMTFDAAGLYTFRIGGSTVFTFGGANTKFLSTSVFISDSGNPTAIASAVLAPQSTTRGFLPPVMTTTQKTAISSPATGLVVYDSTLDALCVHTSAGWKTVTAT